MSTNLPPTTKSQLLQRKQLLQTRLRALPKHTTLPPPSLPTPETHTSYLHKELAWLSADYSSERKRQISQARKLSASILHHFSTLPLKSIKERKSNKAKVKRIGNKLNRLVYNGYWKKIERVVGYKQKIVGETNQRRDMDRMLVKMVKETERYGERLRSGDDDGENGGGGGMSIEEALRGENTVLYGRKKRRDYTRMVDDKYESLYGEDGSDDGESDEEFLLPDEEEEDSEEKADYATFMAEIAHVSKLEMERETGLLMEERDMDLELVLERLMNSAVENDDDKADADEQSKPLIQVMNEKVSDQYASSDDNDVDMEDNSTNEIKTKTLPLLDEDDHEDQHEFHPNDELDDETTIEAEERMGRDMSYAEEIALLQKENEMSIDELRAMYANIDQQQQDDGEDDDSDPSDSEPVMSDSVARVASNNLALLDEDDHEDQHEFHPDNELDDETTIEAEERLGRDMSYAEEIALLEKENEMSIDELRAMYANIDQQQQDDGEDDASEPSDSEPVMSDSVAGVASNNLALLDEDDHEDQHEFHPDNELDDETTIEAEERLGRDMSYAEEIALLQKENEMSIDELRAMYANIDQQQQDDGEDDDSDPSDSEPVMSDSVARVASNNLALLDEDDHEDQHEFHPDNELDDETTIEAEERLGREMSYAEEIALLEKENEMSIDELRAMYANMDQPDDDDSDVMDENSIDDDVTMTAANMTKSSLAMLGTAIDDDEHEEDFTIQDINMEEADDETTIEAEERLGREMTYEQEISQLEQENEMSVEELRKLYGLDQSHNDEPDDSSLKRKEEIESHKERAAKKRKVADEEDEGLAALQSLAATDARARETMLARPFLLASWVKLRNYQHIGLNWLVSLQTRRLNGILADEMGLGKTLQTISMLSYLASYKGILGPHLIIVPTSCLVNWEVEFKRFCPGLKVVCYYGNAKKRKELRYGWTKTNYHHVVITSYQLAVQDSFAFKRKKWYYLILDEAHNIKNFESQRWQTLINFNTQRRLLLTGTPLQNNLMELWSLLHFLMPHVFRNRKDFAYWFSNPMDNIIEGNVKRNDDLINRLHGIIRPFVLRRLKKDVETQLPGKYEHIVKCQLSRRQMFLYEEFMARSSTRKAMNGGNFMGMMNVLMQLRKVCNHPDLFEPRSVTTPFTMEPLSMTTATCVANAVEPESGLEQLSSQLMLPLWSMGYGIPSFDQTCSIDSVLSSQLAQLVTPESLIIERAKAQESSEPKPTAEMDGGLASFLSRIRDYDDRARIDKAHFVARVNSLRCTPTSFPYSNALQNAVTVAPLPLELPLFNEIEAAQIAMTPNDLLAMKRSQEQRAEESRELIDKFVFCVPKAKPTSKPVLFSGSAPKTSSMERELLLKTSDALQKYFSSFQRANSRLTLCFPDKKLVQFDAGKLQTLANLLRGLKQGGHRVLIFTQMSRMLDVLEAFLNLNGHTYLRLDGATDVERRQRLMDRFNSDTKIFCFILSTRSGGLGINLTGADTVIFYDSDWNPAMDAQAQDRAHRIGQTREVHIYRMVTEHSIEENILTKAKQKRNLDFLVMDEGKFHATPVVESNEGVEDESDTEEGFTKGRLKNILGISSNSVNEHVEEDREEEMNQDKMQSAMNLLEDEEDVKAMHKAKKEAAEALEEFDETKELKQDEGEGEVEATKAPTSSKAKKGRPPKKAAESTSSTEEIDQSDKTDDSSKEDDDEKAMEIEFANWQNKVGMDASQINASLNPLERYGLKIKENRDPYYSTYFWKEQERLAEAAATNNDWDMDEIERIKIEEEQKAFEDGDLLATFPDPESLPRQRHLYQREKARLRSEVIKRKLTGQNWVNKRDETNGKVFWHNVDTGESVWETPAVLKMLNEEEFARANGWIGLPNKPLINIMEFLLPSPDRIQCSTVCKSWSSAARDISFVLHVWPVEMGALVMDEKKLSKNHFRTIADAVKAARPGDSIELGDGHYWVNDPGLEIKFPLRFLGDEDDPSHVILELSGEIKWKARGGWMEGIMIRRPKLVTGVTPTNEILRLEHGGRLDIWHCIFDNYGSKGNCVSVDGSEAGGTWERLNVHGASEQFSGLLVNQSANIRLIDCNISSNSGAGITQMNGSNLKMRGCTLGGNGTDCIKMKKEELLPQLTSSQADVGVHAVIANTIVS